MESGNTTGLNSSHQRHLLSIFKHVDDLLSEAAALTSPANSRSPFASSTADASPVQSKVIEDYIARVRDVMLRFLDRQGIRRDSPQTSGVWAVRTSLLFANSSVEELRPRYMRGYGELSGEAGQTMDDLATELQTLLRRMGDYMAQGLGRDPQARLQRLETTTDEVRLLQKVESIITNRGLVELRPTLSMLVDRLDGDGFEVAVFGRVSSGKSSLLNHILRNEFLPVGVTPITAIPIRITYGEPAEATVRFAGSEPIQVGLSRLSEFATEQQNPGNNKHVILIAVRIPEPRLKNGVTFVDTPGLGSLATRGAAETRAYLPRCDLGIILVDAASTLTDEDLAVARMLYDSGANAMVLLSKADLLTPSQRSQAASYVHQHLLSDAGIDVPVHPVSVVGPESRLADEWFERSLLPMFERQQELASLSLRRKIGALREAVIAALSNRLERQAGRPTPEMQAKWEEANLALTRGAGLLDGTWRQNEDLASEMSRDIDAILETAAEYLAKTGAERRNGSFRAGEVVSGLFSRVVSDTGSAIAKNLTDLRTELAKALQVAAIPTGTRIEGDELPEPANLPVIDLSFSGDLELKKPFGSFLGKGFMRRYFFTQLKTQCSSMLDECLRLYERRIKQWSQLAIAELRRAFEARTESLRLEFQRFKPSSGSDASGEMLGMERDLQELQAWVLPGEPEMVGKE